MQATVETTVQATAQAVTPVAAAAASGYSVPRRYLRLSDLIVQAAAFVAAWLVTPALSSILGPGGALHVLPFAWLSPPGLVGALLPLHQLAWIPIVTVPTTMFAMQGLGGHAPLLEQSRARVVVSSLLAPLLGLSFLALILVALKIQPPSRSLIFSFALFTCAGFFAHRVAVRTYKQQRLQAGHYVRHVIAIGSEAAVADLARHFAAHVQPQLYRLVGYLHVTPGPGAESAGAVPYLGGVSDLAGLFVHRPVHHVIVLESEGVDRWLGEVIEQCDFFQAALGIVPAVLLALKPGDVLGVARPPLHLPEVVLKARQFDSDALFVKRLMDIVLSAFLLVVLSPVFLLIAVAIKLTTPGLPVFYPWRVVGYKGRTFTGYKFTTMVADADQRKADLMHLNEMTGPVFKMAKDPRITPLGKFLRKFSVNELPQIWSVLKGDMSLVGPRPAYPHELARYELWHKRKLCVQPGITCLWQVRGRNRTSNFDDWVRMDFEYIDNWSLWLDCVILVRTIRAVVTGSGV